MKEGDAKTYFWHIFEKDKKTCIIRAGFSYKVYVCY